MGRHQEWPPPDTGRKDFDVFVTVDRNLSFQHHLRKFKIAVLVLSAHSNRLADLHSRAGLLAALPDLRVGTVTTISA
jgi:hypothetical protein